MTDTREMRSWERTGLLIERLRGEPLPEPIRPNDEWMPNLLTIMELLLDRIEQAEAQQDAYNASK